MVFMSSNSHFLMINFYIEQLGLLLRPVAFQKRQVVL